MAINIPKNADVSDDFRNWLADAPPDAGPTLEDLVALLQSFLVSSGAPSANGGDAPVDDGVGDPAAMSRGRQVFAVRLSDGRTASIRLSANECEKHATRNAVRQRKGLPPIPLERLAHLRAETAAKSNHPTSRHGLTIARGVR